MVCERFDIRIHPMTHTHTGVVVQYNPSLIYIYKEQWWWWWWWMERENLHHRLYEIIPERLISRAVPATGLFVETVRAVVRSATLWPTAPLIAGPVLRGSLGFLFVPFSSDINAIVDSMQTPTRRFSTIPRDKWYNFYIGIQNWYNKK